MKSSAADVANDQCGEKAALFVQVPCVVPPELYGDRLIFSLFSGCLAIFIFFVTYIYFDYLKSSQGMQYVDNDIKTVSAADYSVHFDIESEQYEHWKTHYFQPTNPMSEMGQFK